MTSQDLARDGYGFSINMHEFFLVPLGGWITNELMQ